MTHGFMGDTTAGPGAVLQMVYKNITGPVNSASNPTVDDSPPLYSELDEIAYVNITPKFADSTIVIQADTWGSAGANVNKMIAIIESDGTADGSEESLAVRQSDESGSAEGNLAISCAVAISDVTLKRYHLMAGCDSGTFYVGRNSSGTDRWGSANIGCIIAWEIKA